MAEIDGDPSRTNAARISVPGMALHGHRPRTLAMRPLWSLAITGGWFCLFGVLGFRAGMPEIGILLQLGWWLVVAAFCGGGAHRSLARRLRLARGDPWDVRRLWNPAGEVRPGPLEPVTGRVPMDWRAKRLLAGWCALVVLSVTSDWTWRVAVVSAFLISMALLKPRMRVAAGVRYSRFPYRTGEPAKFDVRFAKQASAGELQSFACRLRCVSETPRRGFVVFWPEVTCLLDVPGPPAMREPADAEFAVQFDVPADAPGTDLLAEPAIYWELVIDSVWAGGRFEQAFQVPVYGTPSVRP